jgi:hypothetical protein
MKSTVPPLTLKAGMLAAFIVAAVEVTKKKIIVNNRDMCFPLR